VKDTAVVGRNIVCIEVETFLNCFSRLENIFVLVVINIRLLKLVTGVETSTLPARTLDSDGKAANSNNLTRPAPANSSQFLSSIG